MAGPIATFVKGMTSLPYVSVLPGDNLVHTSQTKHDATSDVYTEHRSYGLNSDGQLGVLGQLATTIWPGMLLQGAELARVQISPVPVPLYPQNLVFDIYVPGGSQQVAYTINDPSLASYFTARQDVLKQPIQPRITGASKLASFYSSRHLQLQLSLHFVSPMYSFNAEYSNSNLERRQTLFALFEEETYRASVDALPFHAISEERTDLEFVQQYCDQGGNPLMYVQSVTYGRRAFLSASFESEDASNLTAFKAAASYIASKGAVTMSTSERELIERSDIVFFTYGGEGQLLAWTIDEALKAYKHWIEIEDDERARLSLPLAFMVRHLHDSSSYVCCDLTTYNRSKLVPRPLLTRAEVTITCTDENRDHDSWFDVRLECPSLFGGDFYAQIAYQSELPDRKSETRNLRLRDLYLHRDDLRQSVIHFSISPNGNDTFRFDWGLKLSFADGKTSTFSGINGQVTEKQRRATYVL